MTGNKREKQKAKNEMEMESSSGKKPKQSGRLTRSEVSVVANDSRQTNKAKIAHQLTSDRNEMTEATEKSNESSEKSSINNNNVQIGVNERIVSPKLRGKAKQVSVTKQTPTDKVRNFYLGDDVTVLVDTTEFGELDGEFDGDLDEILESQDVNDSVDSDESENKEGEVFTDRHDNFNETASTVAENEVFFNFKNAKTSIVDQNNEADHVAEVVERLVNEKLGPERAKLKEEFQMLQQMREEYGGLLKEKEKQSHEDGNSKTPQKGDNYQITKSPSDTTIYAPAIGKSPIKGVNSRAQMGKDYIVNIANFVEHMRIQQNLKDQDTATANGEAVREFEVQLVAGTSVKQSSNRDKRQEMRNDADRMIREAELFSASVEHPKGRQNPQNSLDFRLLNDEFFHLTCHIDPMMMDKIKKGQYVDLDKLLPGDRFQGDNTRLEWRVKDGNTYLAPAEKEKKITNIRWWDQAFRVYASIYCRENPDRAGEIWQYIEVIHTAASAYIWDNVAKYDFVFRHLMEYNPGRSWAITYSHMWNITLVELLNKTNFHHETSSISGSQGFKKGEYKKRSGSNAGSYAGGGGQQRKHGYCWLLNGKGNYCKFGEKCKFLNKCSYCDSTQHGITKCPKLVQDKIEEKNLAQ